MQPLRKIPKGVEIDMAETRAITEPASLKWERRKRKFLPYAYLTPTLTLLAALTIVPIVTVFLYSLVDNVIVTQKPPTFVGLDNYVEVLSAPEVQGRAGQHALLRDCQCHRALHHRLVIRAAAEYALDRAKRQGDLPRHLHSSLGLHGVDHRYFVAAAA